MLTVIAEITADPMLRIPRPSARGECEQEARPCPWVGCRHHLAIEVAKNKPSQGGDPRATSIRLNRYVSSWGRRPGLGYTAAEETVRGWIRDALDLLVELPYTCALDVAREHPDGLTDVEIARILGTSEQRIQAERAQAEARLRAELEARGAV